MKNVYELSDFSNKERADVFIDVLVDLAEMDPEMVRDLASVLDSKGYFKCPASTKYHGAYEGGLFDHSFRVMEYLDAFTGNNGLTWQNNRSPYVIGLLHDLCKIDNYVKQEDGAFKYSDDNLYSGHGDKSIIIASSMIQLTEEEACCIRYHMGAFTDKEQWNYYNRAIQNYPNVLWTHTADMAASQIDKV